jgi:hypothetical protein
MIHAMAHLLLIVDQAVRARIAAVRAHARAHPFTFEALKAMVAGQQPPPGDRPEYVVDLGNYRCVWSYEEQPHAGLCWHLSVSCKQRPECPPRFPHPAVVDLLLREFGIHHSIWAALATWQEGVALNVLGRVDPPG